MDGASGVLDVAREIKMRVKAFSYVYRMTNDTKWADRAWLEIQVRTLAVGIVSPISDPKKYRTALGTALRLSDRMMTSGTLRISLTPPNSVLPMLSPTTGFSTSSPMTRRP